MTIENFSQQNNTEPNNVEIKEKLDLRILIADDYENNRNFLKIILADEYPNAKIESVKDGRLLVDKLKSGQNFNFIITDNDMPNMTGLEAIETIRAMGGRFLTIPILMISGDADQNGSLRRKVENFGAVLLKKPYNVDDLYGIIEKIKLAE